jgi:murein DD-endopeptidase MepM/ murein hydrolase activator NlpD
MKRKYYLFLIIPALVLILSFIVEDDFENKQHEIHSASINNNTKPNNSQPTFSQAKPTLQDPQPKDNLHFPIDGAKDRATKKPFGIFITPQNSSVQPERFSGYHTGTDFETFPEEQNMDVPVYAITDGKIIMKKSASGYGGVLVESAEINGQSVTIVYGHLNLASISKKVGDSLGAGEQIGVLGKGYSPETDSERKHLHLGIHKGSSVSILGYVQNKSELSGWIDPMSLKF